MQKREIKLEVTIQFYIGSPTTIRERAKGVLKKAMDSEEFAEFDLTTNIEQMKPLSSQDQTPTISAIALPIGTRVYYKEQQTSGEYNIYSFIKTEGNFKCITIHEKQGRLTSTGNIEDMEAAENCLNYGKNELTCKLITIEDLRGELTSRTSHYMELDTLYAVISEPLDIRAHSMLNGDIRFESNSVILL